MTSGQPAREWTPQVRHGLSKIVVAAFAAGIVLLPFIATTAGAQKSSPVYSVLYTFTGGADGGSSYAPLIPDAAGNLYGTTGYGGLANGCGGVGCGVVFMLDPTGTESVLYTFTGGADGENPDTGVIPDALGNLYGTAGVVFKLSPAGVETVLDSFPSCGSDGCDPEAGLVRDPAGNLYGTANLGGTYDGGVVFKIDAAGSETVLYNFTEGADGDRPVAPLIRDSAGNLYGTTQFGGTGPGVVFKLDPQGHETVLYSFTGGADGAYPRAGLLLDAAGNLYGTTFGGGKVQGICGSNGCGVVFKVDPAGNETVLHTFSGGTDGRSPLGNLISDPAGNLYGTTFLGGNTLGLCSPDGCGVVFKLSPAGREAILYSFTGGTDGALPQAGLLAHKGALYGTASGGGNTATCPYFGGCGVVFKLAFTDSSTPTPAR